MTDYTAADKFKEIQRELYWRRRVYPKMIANNSLTQKMAAKQIGILEAIADDYYQPPNLPGLDYRAGRLARLKSKGDG